MYDARTAGILRQRKKEDKSKKETLKRLLIASTIYLQKPAMAIDCKYETAERGLLGTSPPGQDFAFPPRIRYENCDVSGALENTYLHDQVIWYHDFSEYILYIKSMFSLFWEIIKLNI